MTYIEKGMCMCIHEYNVYDTCRQYISYTCYIYILYSCIHIFNFFFSPSTGKKNKNLGVLISAINQGKIIKRNHEHRYQAKRILNF